MPFLSYWFWPNPGNVHYSSPKVELILAVCFGIILLSLVLRWWRAGLANPITRKLPSSWSSATFWFGFTGLVLVVSRVEMIQFLAMRVLWLVWGIVLAVYVLFQFIQFRRRHYVIVKQERKESVIDKYLPERKRR